MLNRICAVAGFLLAAGAIAAPASAQNEIVITQAKANVGGVTPGDAAGFPVTLSTPGAYVLGGDLTVPANRNGIVVMSNNVDIDLNGFRIDGGSVANYGVYTTFGESRIHDGVIAGFKADGLHLAYNYWVVQNMQIIRNDRAGISSGGHARILNDTISANQADGIQCGSFCHVEENNVSGNGGSGVVMRSGLAIGNTLYSNGGYALLDNAGTADSGFANSALAHSGANDETSGFVSMHSNLCNGIPC